ncbi:hypothetical protein DFJ58DRAFT_847010 [Suillus subalutaceus]|uniref:uncharacterized protein n=1 Tax=Suillus subalutaceus TaxID=48586 RepID=UPI001B86DB8C|nr:uncharacterized protein DFJ58DRAFT_847010 [Suillus subalutaceus]KAG1836372.1 hypothetical protein DFJ58DRAFT_847010 [Suillus subalutaceus]
MPACKDVVTGSLLHSGLNKHIANSLTCRQKWQDRLQNFSINVLTLVADHQLRTIQTKKRTHLHIQGSVEFDQDHVQSRSVQIEEVTDDPGPVGTWCWVEEYPDEMLAGAPCRPAEDIVPTKFDTIKDNQEANGESVWGPFNDEEEWELARWLIQNVGQNQTDEFLKLPIVRNHAQVTYPNNRSFLKKIDALPTKGPEWHCDLIKVAGDIIASGWTGEVIAEFMMKCGQGDWWWDMQGKLPKGATIAPVILASDKTSLSQFRGDKSAWPVCMEPFCLATSQQQSLTALAKELGPLQGIGCFMNPLIEAGKEGVEMKVSVLSVVFTETAVVNLWLHSYEMKRHLDYAGTQANRSQDLPYSDIFGAITPDILHQLHKGVFHDHLLKWCTKITGEKEIDEHYQKMSNYPGLCHFSQGISLVSQWTGTEHREMQRVFMGVLAGAVQPTVIQAARAVLDFIYYAQFHAHTSQSLDALESALREFHNHKHIFVDLGVRNDFNIPKMHSMQHYVASIKSRGSADGFNTEFPKRLHIDFTKNVYRATNKKDYVVQMTKWLARQEAVDQFVAYLDWRLQRKMDDEEADGDVDDVEGGIALNADVPEPQPPTVDYIAQTFGAVNFFTALTQYLNRTPPPQNPATPHKYRCQSVIWDSAVHMSKSMDCIRAVLYTPPSGRSAGSPGQFDTVLVQTEGTTNVHTQGTALEGLQVAQVRLIFDLPMHLRTTGQPFHLALVEWFNPFRARDALLQLHTVSRSYAGQAPRTEVIPISQISRSCHLIPKFGTHVDQT